jgi:osmoprotectant transport system substrate-binding protein
MRPPARHSLARLLRAGLSIILTALACVACGQGGTGGASAAGAPSSSTTTSTSTSTSSSTGATTTSSSSTPALPGTGKPQIIIGDKNFTEQFVLGELYRQALVAQGFTVQLNRNIGPTEVTLQALKNGSLSMYPEYLYIFNSAIAHYAHPFRSRLQSYDAAQHYALAHGLELLDPTPFSDTDAIGVTVGYAEANHLNSLRDLGRVSSSLTIGGPPQFQQSSPGLPTIEQAYGFTPAGFKTLAVGDQYTALNDGSVQAADVGTTDGQLTSGDYKLLSDPSNLFEWGNAVPVVPAAVLAAEGPAFAETINRVSALLNTSVMRVLNAAVDVAGQDPTAVAQQFLETHGVIPPAPS